MTLALGFLAFAALHVQHTVLAAPSDIEVTIMAAPNLIVDSNVLSPSTQAPEVATVIGRFCNTSGTIQTNVMGYIGDYDSTTPANSDPGIYPAKTNPGIFTGTYSFTHLGGTRDATRIIGDLDPGECGYQYWSFSYPKTANGGTIPTWGTSVKPDDDLSLDFDIWAAQSGTICNNAACNKTHTATMRNEISAMANKIEPNGNPGGQWFNTNSQTVQVGQTITTNGILYRLGNVNQGFDNNGDLVPDYNAWLQPIGNPTYDPSCFRLVEASGVLTVTRSSGNPDLVIPFNHSLNQNNDAPLLYFTDLPTDNTDVNGLVYYTFMALGGPCTIPISPYQEVASGSSNEKFNGDFGGGGPGTIESYAPNISFDKSGPTGTSVGGGNFTYTINYQNTGTSSMGLALSSGLNAGFVVSDTVPVGLNYVGSSAGGTPPGGNSYVIYYSTNSGTTWATTDPGTVQSTSAARVMIQWWLTNPLAASGSGTATWQAAAPANYYAAGGSPFIKNCADARLGTGSPFAEDCAVTMVAETGSIGNLVWADDGTGGGSTNNGLQDGTEAGINTIAVKLYWDKNGNGALDANDVLVSTQNTAFVSATANYNFTQLPAANYIVGVDTVDTDLPTGYGPTTPTSFAIALSTGQSYTSADFGFGPTLSLAKNLSTPNPAYVGETVQYDITLSNTLPGDGTAQGFCTYSLWASVQPPADGTPSSGSGNSAWQNIPSGLLGQPDDTLAYTVLANNADDVGISGFNMYGQSGTITSVRMQAYVRELKNLQASTNESLQLIVFRNNLTAETFAYDGLSYFTGAAGTDYIINQTLTAPGGGWLWSHFQNNYSEIRAIGGGTGSPADRGDLGMDAVAFVITTDQQCGGAASTINELPLIDTYDSTYLQFVSANPAPSSQVPGTITWNNLGPLYAGGSKTVTVVFTALNTVASTNNTATSSNGKFGTGRTVNTATDTAAVPINSPGSIAGTLWAESNAANQWTNPTGYDGSDSRIPGVTVQLYGCYALVTGVSQLLTPTTASATNRACTDTANGGTWVLLTTKQTASDGTYTFSGLRPGYYNVKALETTLPTGMTTRTGDPDPAGNGAGTACGTCDGQWNTDTANLNTFNDIASAENVTAISFGYRDPDSQGAITGYVWNDRDADGVWDTGEEPIPNTSVYLCTTTPCNSSTPGAVLATTDSNGRYAYGNLAAGTYYVGVTSPSGMSQSGDPDVPGVNCGGSCDNQTNAITLATRQISGPYNFGYTGGLTIGDTIYSDWNGDGGPDSGEEGISGVQVSLYRDLDGDGSIDSGDTLLGTQTTNGSGFYQFTNLAGNGNKYLVLVSTSTVPIGYVQSADPDEAGTCTTCDSKQVVTLNASSINTSDFGYQPTGFGSIGDYVWNDLDGDGNQDSTETGISGVTVNLYEDSNNNGTIDAGTDALVASTTTLAYEIVNGGIDISGNGTIGTEDDGTVFGVTILDGSLDMNRSGAISSADDGTFAGYTVINGLVDTNGNGTTGTEDDASLDGLYDFQDLAAGNYIVEIAQSNFTAGQPLEGLTLTSTGAAYTNNGAQVSYDVTLSAGQDFNNADFGFAEGIIGDFIWRDDNGNGTPDPSEPGISGVTVTLYNDVNNNGLFDGGDTLRAATTTNANGLYEFGSLPTGNYVVVVTPPAGYTLTGDPDAYGTGSTPAPPCSTSGSYARCDHQYGIYSPTPPAPYPPPSYPGLRAGEVDRTADFGYQPTAYLGDTLWVDGDNDGVRDTGEGGIPYITVRLCADAGCGTVIATTTTDAAGYYSFGGIANGAYFLVPDTTDPDFPAGLTNTYDPDGTTNSNTNVTVSGNVTTVVGSCSNGTGSCSLTGDFGYRYAGTNTVTGTVWHDDDNGGQIGGTGDIDPAETTRYSGVIVYLWNCNAGSCTNGDETLAGITPTLAYRVIDGYLDIDGDGVTLGDADDDGTALGYTVINGLLDINGDAAITSADDGTFFGYTVIDGFIDVDNDTNTGDADDDADLRGRYRFSSLANGTYAVTVNPNVSPLAGISPTTTTGYTGSTGSNPPAVLSGGTTAVRDFGFLSTMDYGDLPSSYNNTLSAENGPRHTTGSVRLGAAVDSDPDGTESTTSSGDTNDDGVTRSGTWTNGANGAAVSVSVTCPSAPCYLAAWIDWNRDGDFNDTVGGYNERIFLDRAVANGTNVLTFNVPAGTFPGSGSNVTFNTRYRLFAASTGGLAQPTGFAANGEVEDYQWNFTPTAITLKNLTVRPGMNVVWVGFVASLLAVLGAFVLFHQRRKLANALTD